MSWGAIQAVAEPFQAFLEGSAEPAAGILTTAEAAGGAEGGGG